MNKSSEPEHKLENVQWHEKSNPKIEISKPFTGEGLVENDSMIDKSVNLSQITNESRFKPFFI